jgi:hypothetical protein
MMDFHNRVRIQRSPEYIFEVLADLENLPVWQAFDIQVRRASPGEVGVGTTYQLDRKGERRTLTVREFKPGRRMEVETVESKPPQVNLRFDLEPDGPDHTHLTADWSVETGLPGLVEKMASGRVRAMVDENIHKLKELLETGRTTLPDGREVRLPDR